MRSPAGWRLQKQSEPNDSAKLGACEMTLCSDLKGQHYSPLKEAEKCTFKIGPSVHSLPLAQIRKVCGPGCSAALSVKASHSLLEGYTHICSLWRHCVTVSVGCWNIQMRVGE